jgi:hypothetical protein
MSDYVMVKTSITVKLLRETPEVSGPRGWGEGAIETAEIKKDSEGLLLTFSNGVAYLLRPEVVEALYDVWQEVPVGSYQGR